MHIVCIGIRAILHFGWTRKGDSGQRAGLNSIDGTVLLPEAHTDFGVVLFVEDTRLRSLNDLKIVEVSHPLVFKR